MKTANAVRAKEGFTLIELLIVIAIIAILALIAIPNFLEAQTRSKVSRAMADMRTLATAIEAYNVDYNGYILSVCPFDQPTLQKYQPTANKDPRTSWNNYSCITTPVAYITSIVRDPFSNKQQAAWWDGRGGQNPYHLYTGNYQKYGTANYATAPRQVYLMVSLGPDIDFDTKVDPSDNDFLTLYDSTWGFNNNTEGGAGIMYDPSNGTISRGDIYRMSDAGKMPNYIAGRH